MMFSANGNQFWCIEGHEIKLNVWIDPIDSLGLNAIPSKSLIQKTEDQQRMIPVSLRLGAKTARKTSAPVVKLS